jgi:uncharacterized protein (DUF427 family)
MSLTTGRGPLSTDRAGRFTRPVPDGVIYVEPFPRRVRAIVGGDTVIDSEQVLLVHRPGRPPAYAIPADAVPAGLAGVEADPDAPGHVSVPRESADAWFEEDQQVFTYPRNPYHRVDCVPTSRRLRVEVAGTVLVDTTETTGVYETALAPRLYVAPGLVRTDLLTPSPTTSFCSYKGTASYWHAVVDGVTVEDVAWSYEEPHPESTPIGGFLSFDDQRATVTTDLPQER